MGTPRHAAPPVAKRGCGKYPNTQQVEHTDVYTSHKEGIVRVRDPYNWLEEDTAARKNWLEQQDKLTRSVLTQVGARDDIKKAIWSAYDYDRVGLNCRYVLLQNVILTYPLFSVLRIDLPE